MSECYDGSLILEDKNRYDDIRRILRVACITDKIREARLRRFGHVQRQEEEDCVKRIFGGRRSWTTEQGKTEKKVDRRHQVQHGGLVAQLEGR